MQVNSFSMFLTSEDPDSLAGWYRDVLELPAEPTMGNRAFRLGERTTFVIQAHSETVGKAKEPQRVLINFMVEDLAAERTRLLARGVEFIRAPAREEWGGVISTLLDPDGNYLQLIEFKPGS